MTHFQSTIQAHLLQHEWTAENIYLYTHIHLKKKKTSIISFCHPSIHFCFLWSPYSTSGLPPATSPPVRCAEKPSFNSAWLPTLPQSPPSSQRTPDSNSKIKENLFHWITFSFLCLQRIYFLVWREFFMTSSVCRASPATR